MFNVQFITHFTDRISYRESAEIALAGGCKWIQLRMKGAEDEEVEKTAMEIMPLCRKAGATFILDDRVELVRKIGADGVHLGKNDMPIKDARKILDRNFIIGGTANTIEDIVRINEEGADYIGCGPFRYTETKAKLAPILGEKSYRELIRQMRELKISLPIVGIGGVTADDIPLLHSIGLSGIALSGSILHAQNPEEEMRKIMKITQNL